MTDDDRLYPAPRNAIGPPHGADKDGRAGAGRVLIARFDWPSGAVVQPVEALWISGDRVLVEWPLDWQRVERRRTWLPRDDVAARVRVR